MKKARKPYEKPELKGKIVFEASGVICCKLTNATCSNTGRDSLGKATKATNTS